MVRSCLVVCMHTLAFIAELSGAVFSSIGVWVLGIAFDNTGRPKQQNKTLKNLDING